MPCAKTDARLREDTSAGGGGVNQITARLRRRPSSPNKGDTSGFEAKEAGSMVAGRRQEGERWERKIRKLTDKNGAAKQGQTANREKKQKGLIPWTRQALYLARWSYKIPPCLSRSLRGILIDCEAFCCLILNAKRLCADLS